MAQQADQPPQTDRAPNGLDRRKARTRAALVQAAQAFIAAGQVNVPILEITQAADVGLGSFYNHFESKEQLFQAALEDALDAYGAVLDELTRGLDDPAEVFAQSFRLTGRLHRRQPELSKVLLRSGLTLAGSDKGLAPRARRDLESAARAGRFSIRDPDLALAIVVGAALCLAQLLHDHPDRDDAESADLITEDLLRMLGLPADQAHKISRQPLPDLDDLPAGPRRPRPQPALATGRGGQPGRAHLGEGALGGPNTTPHQPADR